jgi:16S rRNA processing protein RimM
MPAQDLLVIERPSGEVLVPFVKAIVPAVDIAAGTMTITPPPGLLEELPESDDDEKPPTPPEADEAPAE